MSKDSEQPSCTTCNRLHAEGEPCPRRIARALATASQSSLDALSGIDKTWMTNHRGISIEDLLEEEIAGLM